MSNENYYHTLTEDVVDGVETVKEAVKKELIVHWKHLPTWQQDNHYIQSGYRAASNSYKESVASLGYLHNETINIWTHLLGSLAFAAGSIFFWHSLLPRYGTASSTDVIVFACFFLGAVVCLGMSATFHTISNHSKSVSRFGNKLDYLGIVFLIWGSFIPAIYYGFSCDPEWINTYWEMITSIAFGTAIAATLPAFAGPACRPYRAAMFTMMGLFAVLPVLHGIAWYGVDGMELLMGLRWVVLQGVLYIIGAFLYATRIPERLAPGRFDIVGNSHQIFHILVVLAALSHLKGLLVAFDHHHMDGAKDICFTRYQRMMDDRLLM